MYQYFLSSYDEVTRVEKNKQMKRNFFMKNVLAELTRNDFNCTLT